MKVCPKCNAQVDDQAGFCPVCGMNFAAQNTNTANNYNAQPNYNQQQYANYGYQQQPAVAFDPTDHTAEFDAQDISDNKVVCMLIYLAGYIGILVALLLSNTSKYVGFHLRQALKIEVTNLLIGLCTVALGVLCIIPILGWIVAGLGSIALGIFSILVFVARIICFFDVCKGKAKEPKFVTKLTFLK